MENKNSNLSKAERLEILAMKIHEFIYNGSTYSLKDRFLNNKLSTSERLTKQDLKLLEEFLSDIDKLGGSNEELIKNGFSQINPMAILIKLKMLFSVLTELS